MPVKTKRKTVVKVAPLTPKYKRLRLREWMMFWVLFAATITLVYTIFGNVDLRMLMPTGVTSTASDDQQALVSELRAEVVNLNTALNGLEQAQSSDKRIFADSKGIPFGELYFNDQENLSVQCDRLKLNTSTPTQTIVWRDEKSGLQAALPYNFSWGNDAYALTPFESLDMRAYSEPITGITFGPVTKGYDCIPGRDSELRVTGSTGWPDSNRFPSTLRATMGVDLGSIKQRTVSGMTVVSYKITELAGGYFWDAFGRNYHYTIRSNGWLTDAEAIKIIQSLRVTK